MPDVQKTYKKINRSKSIRDYSDSKLHIDDYINGKNNFNLHINRYCNYMRFVDDMHT